MISKEEIQRKYGQEYNLIPNPRLDLYVKYTQEGLRGSVELNMALIEYFYSGLPFYNNELRQKAFEINNGFLVTNKELTVYHGTNCNLHEPKSDFTTYAFFSTTIVPEIAETYGKIIYKIVIPVGYPIINLYDQSNMQILLPIGTNINKITIDNIINNKYTYICEINKENTITNTIKTLSQILEPQIKPIEINIKSDNTLLELNLKDISSFNSVKITDKLKASSTIYSCYFNNQSYGKTKNKTKDNYIIKDILKKKDFTKCFKTDDYICRRIMNEILASLVYQSYGLKTFDYELVYNDKYNNKSKYMIGSDKIDNIIYYQDPNKSELLLKGYIVDCILSNWDTYNNNNIGFINDEVIRTDVGGALGYRGIGDFKLSFFNNVDPKEHITFIRENWKIRELFKNIKTQELFESMFKILKPINVNEIKKNPKIVMFMPYYEIFINKILHAVSCRNNYYFKYKLNVINEIKQELNIQTQSGGSKQFVIYQGKVRKVYTTNKIRYIVLNKTKIDLKSIKGKYKYQKQMNGGNPQEDKECFIHQEEFDKSNFQDIDLIGTQGQLEELLKNLKPKTNSNNTSKNGNI